MPNFKISLTIPGTPRGLILLLASVVLLILLMPPAQAAEPPSIIKIAAKGVRFDLSSLKELLNGYLPSRVSELKVNGKVSLEVELALDRKQMLVRGLRSSIDYSGVEFSNPEGTFAASALEGSFSFQIRLSSKDDSLPFAAAFKLLSGEFLMDRYYFDLGKTPMEASIDGRLLNGGRSLMLIPGSTSGRRFMPRPNFSIKRALLEFDGIGRFYSSGTIERADKGWLTDLLAEVRIDSLRSAFKLFILEPYQEIVRSLKGSRLEGNASMGVKMRGPIGSPHLEGRLKLSAVRMVLPEADLKIQSFELDLPFSISKEGGAAGNESKEPEASSVGMLRIGSLDLSGVYLEDIHQEIILSGNCLTMPEAIEFTVMGGRVTLSGLRIDRLLGPSRTLETVITIEGMELSRLTASLKHPLKGSLNSNHLRIVIRDGTMSSEGQIDVRIFQGRLKVDNIEGEQLFSPARKIRMDLDFKEINLEEMTRSMESGTITGIIRGRIRDLTISFGQPESFDLEIESVPREGISQIINAKAIQNISILSSGMAAPLLPFIKNYYYSKIGIACRLENDYFFLRGTIHEAGEEYFVIGPRLPLGIRMMFGIDMVNKVRGNRISWKDMLRRIKRVTEQGGKGVRMEKGAD